MVGQLLGLTAMLLLVFAQTMGEKARAMQGGPELSWWWVISCWERGEE